MPENQRPDDLMDDTSGAVVEDPTKPLMDGGPSLMDPVGANGEPATGNRAAAASDDRGGEMAPMGGGSMGDPMDAPPPTIEDPTGLEPDHEAGDDVGDGYLRLTVRLTDGDLSVIGAKIVDGPLLQPDPTGEMMYQAAIGDRRVGIGGLPELEVEHGFAPEDDPTAGHAVGPSDGNEFIVRIPRQDITADELDALEIELVRPAETTASPPPGMTLEAAAADEGRSGPDVVARLRGVDLSQAPSEQAEAVRRRLR